MPTFAKGDHAALPPRHVSYRERQDQARSLAKAAQDHTPIRTSRFQFQNPVDLRGIPAVGRCVPGHIAGTHPEHAATR